MDNMENSSYHNDIIKGFDFNREDFKSPAKRNLMIGAEEAAYSVLFCNLPDYQKQYYLLQHDYYLQ